MTTIEVKKIRISDAQAEMIEHRLEVPDCIHDVISCDSQEFTTDEVWDVADVLRKRMSTGWLWCESEIEKYVLEDAVGSSTWFAVNEVEANHTHNGGLMMGRLMRTVVSATKKVAELTGREIVPVLW